jgi:hypothetical protein
MTERWEQLEFDFDYSEDKWRKHETSIRNGS